MNNLGDVKVLSDKAFNQRRESFVKKASEFLGTLGSASSFDENSQKTNHRLFIILDKLYDESKTLLASAGIAEYDSQDIPKEYQELYDIQMELETDIEYLRDMEVAGHYNSFENIIGESYL